MTSNAWTRKIGLHAAVVAAAALILLTGVGCSDDGQNVLSDDPDVVLTDARISVNGQSVDGMTLPRGHGEGETAHFEAVLMDEHGQWMEPTVWVEHHGPGAMGMMGSSSLFQLHDDGTHGDQVAGDGVYCYDDDTGQHGCHTAEAMPGEHHYEFYGMDEHGHESNHMIITVTITE